MSNIQAGINQLLALGAAGAALAQHTVQEETEYTKLEGEKELAASKESHEDIENRNDPEAKKYEQNINRSEAGLKRTLDFHKGGSIISNLRRQKNIRGAIRGNAAAWEANIEPAKQSAQNRGYDILTQKEYDEFLQNYITGGNQ